MCLLYRLKNAQQEQDSKTVCCCCCESGPITAVLRIDRTGYVPGEVITCNAEINDGSGHGTASSKVKFKMVGCIRVSCTTKIQFTAQGLFFQSNNFPTILVISYIVSAMN